MKRRVLILAALLCAVYLSGALVILGIDKFYYVLAGGRKFATLPNLSTQLGIGGSYLALSICIYSTFLGINFLAASCLAIGYPPLTPHPAPPLVGR